MKIAISNSSPLILLTKINALEILLYFFEKIYIPPEVYHEVVENGLKRGEGEAVLIQNLVVNSNIEVKSPEEVKLPLTFKKSLHRGELEAITLAYSFPNHPILLDDEEARIFALI